MPNYTLDATNLTATVNLPARATRVSVASAGTWVGTVAASYTINGETRTYTNRSYTGNFDFEFNPATSSTTFTFTRTSGTVELAVTSDSV